MFDTKLCQFLSGLIPGLGSIRSPKFRRQCHVVGRVQRIEKTTGLEDEPNPSGAKTLKVAVRISRDISSEQFDPTFSGRNQSGGHLKQGRLAASTWSEHDDHLSTAHFA
jgi:hypothetical protein